MKKIGLVTALVAGLMGYAQADCSYNATWTNNQSTGLTLVDVTTDATAKRYEGVCAVKSDAINDTLMANMTSNNISHGYFRFYVYLPSGQSNLMIFSAAGVRANGSVESVVSARVTGDTLTVNQRSTPFAAGYWHMLQLEVNLDAQTFSVTVDENEVIADATLNTTASTIDAVVLGSIGGTQRGNVYFDSFVASDNAPIGAATVSVTGTTTLIPGDANGDGSITPYDALQILQEYSSGNSASGVPDADRNGVITPFDALQVLQTYTN